MVTRAQLQSIEWAGWCRDDGDACPACGRRREDGHNSECFIAAALAAPPQAPPEPLDLRGRSIETYRDLVLMWRHELERLTPTPPQAPPEPQAMPPIEVGDRVSFRKFCNVEIEDAALIPGIRTEEVTAIWRCVWRREPRR